MNINTFNRNLIFDVGAHEGDDSAVYLRLGYRVIAVEANPLLIPILLKRFKDQIESNNIIIVNKAIGLDDGSEESLFLDEDSSKSSIYEKTAAKKIKVWTRTLASLIKEFEIPFYCKIDIEGSDLIALETLSNNILPPYISVELSCKSLKQLIETPEQLFLILDQLHKLGYARFKLVDQEKQEVLDQNSFYKKNLTLSNRVKNKIVTMFSLDFKSKFLRKFNLEKSAEISGYPSFNLDGPWFTFIQMKSLISFHFQEYIKVVHSYDLIFWVDLHATIEKNE